MLKKSLARLLAQLTNQSRTACCELIRLFIVSARARAEAEAVDENVDTIAPEHIESIMPELFMDLA